MLTRDARTLIGVLAYVEGALLDGSVTEHSARQLHDRFVTDGLLPPESTDRDVRQVLNDVNHRLRYAIGEYQTAGLGPRAVAARAHRQLGKATQVRLMPMSTVPLGESGGLFAIVAGVIVTVAWWHRLRTAARAQIRTRRS